MKTWKDLETTHCMYCVGYPINVSSLQLAFSRYLVEITVVLLVKYEIQPQLFAAAAPELKLHSGFVKERTVGSAWKLKSF